MLSYALNFGNSSEALVLDNYALDDFPNQFDGVLDSATDDYFVSAGVNSGNPALEAPPAKVFGTFDVTAPTAVGDYVLTADFTTGNETENTVLSTAQGQPIDVTDYGDLVIRVATVVTEGATLDLIPSAPGGTVSEENGQTVIEVSAGTTVSISAQVLDSNEDVLSYALNFQNSSSELVFTNSFAVGDFPNQFDGVIDSTANDYFVSTGVNSGDPALPAPPPKVFGTFDVIAPAAVGDYTVTSNFTTGNETENSVISNAQGQAIPVIDYGDLIIRVMVTEGATLDLTPDAADGTVSEENGTTVITVSPGTTVSVSARVTDSNEDVLSYALNFQNSSSQLVLNNFAAGDFPNEFDATLDSTANDYFVSTGVNSGDPALMVPPPRLFGTFDVIAPTAIGDYTVTSNFTTGNETENSVISNAQGQAIPVVDFGDLIIRVEDEPVEATLDLTPDSADGTVTEENGTTVITVAPGTTIDVTARITDSDEDVLSYALNFQNSSSALVLNNFSAGTDFPNQFDAVLDSAANDYFISTGVNSGNPALSVPPPRVFGTFDVIAPTVAGDYTLTSNFTTGNETENSVVSNAQGQAISIADFGDLIIRVARPTANIIEDVRFEAPDGAPDPAPLPKGDLPSLWADQRSSAGKIVFTFRDALTATPAANDVVLTNLGVNADADADTVIASSAYQISLSTDGKELTIEVPRTTDANGIHATLPDGVYKLDVTVGGETLSVTGNETNKFFVLRGDWNGDGAVSNSDSRTLAYWFLVVPGNGVPEPSQFVDLRSPVGINNQDFTLFTQAFGSFLTFPTQAEPERVDVNADGSVTALDALNVINALSSEAEGEEMHSRLDVNQDGKVSAADALMVINRLAADVAGANSGAEDDSEDDVRDQLWSEEAFLSGLF